MGEYLKPVQTGEQALIRVERPQPQGAETDSKPQAQAEGFIIPVKLTVGERENRQEWQENHQVVRPFKQAEAQRQTVLRLKQRF